MSSVSNNSQGKAVRNLIMPQNIYGKIGSNMYIFTSMSNCLYENSTGEIGLSGTAQYSTCIYSGKRLNAPQRDSVILYMGVVNVVKMCEGGRECKYFSLLVHKPTVMLNHTEVWKGKQIGGRGAGMVNVTVFIPHAMKFNFSHFSRLRLHYTVRGQRESSSCCG